MTRTEILDTFRAEYPEMTDRVIADTLLNKWAIVGDKYICARTRCIVSDFTFTSVVSTSVYNTKYDLTSKEPKFYDIDTYPGGGVIYDDEPLDESSIAKLDAENSGWRTSDASTPEAWYRRGKFLYFDCPVVAAKTVRVYAVLVSDDFDGADITPYNQLEYLEPFHYGIVKYLGWKAKSKEGKPADAQAAQVELGDYITVMKNELAKNKYAPIYFRGPNQGLNNYGI